MSKYTFITTNNCPFCNSIQLKTVGKRLNGNQGFSPRQKLGVTVSIVKCTQCQLIFANPMPIPENIFDHYGIPPEQYWKPDYFKIDPNYLNVQLNWLKQLKTIVPGMKALDIGAGLGKGMLAFECYGFEAYGIEPSEPFYDRAIHKMRIDPSKLMLSSVEAAEFKTESFDVIFFSAVLEHLYHPSEILLKVLNWLKPDGLLYIQVPSSNWLISQLINLQYRLRCLEYVTNLSPMHEPFHLYEFSIKSFVYHAKQHNYNIVDSRYFVCDTFLPKYLDPILKPLMARTDTGMELGVWLHK